MKYSSTSLFTALIALAFFSGSAEARQWYVSAGMPLQPVLDQVQPGDTITLQAGATFTGWHKLRKKATTGWITIQSSAVANLPAGKRVHPSDVIHMATLLADKQYPALSADDGAAYYRIIGIEFRSSPGLYVWELIELGYGDETTLAQSPSNIELDRLYIHGDAKVGSKRGITMNSRNTTLKNSYLSDFKSTWQDSNAIAGWNGAGPFTIQNNYIEAAAENLGFGGSKPRIPNLVPSDIRIIGNHIFKPLSWKPGDPSYAGTHWIEKNAFELKNARRVLFEGNIVENVWADGQHGYAIQLTVRTANSTVPWAEISSVTIRRNIFRNCGGGVNLSGYDSDLRGVEKYITIQDNIFEIDSKKMGGPGTFAHVMNGTYGVVIDHNTIVHDGHIVAFEGGPSKSFTYRNNISAHNTYGIRAAGSTTGIPSLTRFAAPYSVVANVMAGGSAALYPAGNYFPASLNNVGFTNLLADNYQLNATSPYLRKGTDGKNLGADMALIKAATAGVDQEQQQQQQWQQ